MPGDSNVQAISNVQRLQRRLWLIILSPCRHLLILSRCFMAISRIWRADRGRLCQFLLSGTVNSLHRWWTGSTQGSARVDCLQSPTREAERETFSSPGALSVMCLWLARLRKQWLPRWGKSRRRKVNKYLRIFTLLKNREFWQEKKC